VTDAGGAAGAGDAEARREFVVRRCEELLGAELTFPFGPQPAVFKVSGRMFALLDLDDEPSFVSLKCDPEYAAVLVAEHPGIRPGWHLNKRHWISVDFDGDLPEGLLEELLFDSYHLVLGKVPRSRRPLGQARAPQPGDDRSA
jgi:predicted DNA-binding protein (MmcQ/YjbR family)